MEKSKKIKPEFEELEENLYSEDAREELVEKVRKLIGD